MVVRGARLAARLVVVVVVVVVVELVVCSSGCSRKSFSLDDSARAGTRGHSAKISNLWCRNRVACRTKNRAGRFFFSPFFLLMWRFLQSSPHQQRKKKKVRISSDFAISYRGKSSRNRVVRKSYPLRGMERANPKRCKLEPERERERDRHPLEARAQVPDKREREREAHKATMSSVAKFLV